MPLCFVLGFLSGTLTDYLVHYLDAGDLERRAEGLLDAERSSSSSSLDLRDDEQDR